MLKWRSEGDTGKVYTASHLMHHASAYLTRFGVKPSEGQTPYHTYLLKDDN